MLGSVGKDAGLSAAKEIHRAVDGAIPDAQKAVEEVVSRVATEIVNVAAGAIERSAGAVCTSLGSLPAFIVDALDGLTITIKIERRKE